MKKNPFFANVALSIILVAVAAVYILVGALSPNTLLVSLSVPAIALLALVSLAAEYYIAPAAHRNAVAVIISAVLAGLSFGLIFMLSGMVAGSSALKTGLVGGAVYLVCDLLFSSIKGRFTAKAKLAPAVTVLLLFLAVQGFFGMFL